MELNQETKVNLKLMVLKYDRKIKDYRVNVKRRRATVITISGEKKRWTFTYIISNF